MMGKRGPSGKYTGTSKGRKASSNPTSRQQVIDGSVDERDPLALENVPVLPVAGQSRSADRKIGDDWATAGSATTASSEQSRHPSENDMTLPVGCSTLGEDWNQLAEDVDDLFQDADLEANHADQSDLKNSSPSTLKELQRWRHPKKSANTAEEPSEQSQQTMAIGFSEISNSDDASFPQDDEGLDDLFVPSSILHADENAQSTDRKAKGHGATKTQPACATKVGQSKSTSMTKPPKKEVVFNSSKASVVTADTPEADRDATSVQNMAAVLEPPLKKQPRRSGSSPSRPLPRSKKPRNANSNQPQRKRRKQIAKTPFQQTWNRSPLKTQESLDSREREARMETQCVGYYSDTPAKIDVGPGYSASLAAPEPTNEKQSSRHDLPSQFGSDQTDHVLDLENPDAAAIIPMFYDASAHDEDQRDLASDMSMPGDCNDDNANDRHANNIQVNDGDFNDDDFQRLVSVLEPGSRRAQGDTGVGGRGKVSLTRGITKKTEQVRGKQDIELSELSPNRKTEVPTRMKKLRQPDPATSLKSEVKLGSLRKPNEGANTSKQDSKPAQQLAADDDPPQPGPIFISSDESSALSEGDAPQATPRLPLQPPAQDSLVSVASPVKLTPRKQPDQLLSSVKMRPAGIQGSKKTQIIAFNANGPLNSGWRSPNKRVAAAPPSSHQQKRAKTNKHMDQAISETNISEEESTSIATSIKEDSPACAAVVQRMTRIESTFETTGDQGLCDLLQEGPVDQRSRPYKTGSHFMTMPTSSSSAKVPAHVLHRGHYSETIKSHQTQSESLNVQQKPRTVLRGGNREPQRVLPRKKSIVDERGSPNPEPLPSVGKMAHRDDSLEKAPNPPKDPPVWKLPMKEKDDGVGKGQQGPNGSREAFSQTGNRSFEVTDRTSLSTSIGHSIRHGRTADLRPVNSSAEMDNPQKPPSLAALARYSTVDPPEQSLLSTRPSTNDQAPIASQSHEAPGLTRGFYTALEPGAFDHQSHASQVLINQLQTSGPPSELASVFRDGHKPPGELLTKDSANLHHSQARVTSMSSDSMPGAVHRIIGNLLDQLEATKPGVTRIAELYWDNGNQALDKLEQIHWDERQRIMSSFDRRRLTYIQRCQNMHGIISDLVQEGEKTSVEQTEHRDQGTKSAVDALEQLKISLCDVSGAF